MKLIKSMNINANINPSVVAENPKCCTVKPATVGPIKFPRKNELVQVPKM